LNSLLFVSKKQIIYSPSKELHLVFKKFNIKIKKWNWKTGTDINFKPDEIEGTLL
jgi:hypothetical protein